MYYICHVFLASMIGPSSYKSSVLLRPRDRDGPGSLIIPATKDLCDYFTQLGMCMYIHFKLLGSRCVAVTNQCGYFASTRPPGSSASVTD